VEPGHEHHGHSHHGHAHHHAPPAEQPLVEMVCDDCPCDGAVEPHRAGVAAPAQDARRRVLGALVLSLLVMAAQLVGGWLSGSLALATDALHSLTDVAALAISLLAMLIASRPVNARKTYGYHRLEILSALANGVSLLALSVWVVTEAVERLRAPVPVQGHLVMIFAGIGLVAMSFSAWILHGSKGVNLRGAYLHVLGDALTSLTVLVGGAVISWSPGWAWIDPALSIGIVCVLVVSAFRLVRETVDILLEATPTGIDSAAVSREIGALPGIVSVHDLHIWTIASGVPSLSAHVVVHGEPGSGDAHLRQIKTLLLERYRIGHTTLQLESTSYSHLGH
jgi:cobalt-zinc-cadmium efflux system protein